MTSRGFYLIHRGWMNSRDFKPEPFTEREAFLWSMEQAAFEAHGQWFNGSQFNVARGEFVTSTRVMAKAFGWGEHRVRLFIARMEKAQKWTQRPARKAPQAPTIITVCNYSVFQSPSRGIDAASDAPADAAAPQSGRSDDAEQKEWITNGNELEAVAEKGAPRPRSPAMPFLDAMSIWNDAASAAGWRTITSLNDNRKKHLGSRLKENGLEGWRLAIARAQTSAYLASAEPPSWFTFDWVIKSTNFLKLNEGNYDRRAANRLARHQSADGLSPTSRAAVAVFGTPGTGQ